MQTSAMTQVVQINGEFYMADVKDTSTGVCLEQVRRMTDEELTSLCGLERGAYMQIVGVPDDWELLQ